MLLSQVFPAGDAHAFAANIFKTFDVEGTGRINFRQFISVLSIQLKGSLGEKLEWVFDVYDIEKNGYVSKEEVLEMVRVREQFCLFVCLFILFVCLFICSFNHIHVLYLKVVFCLFILNLICITLFKFCLNLILFQNVVVCRLN